MANENSKPYFLLVFEKGDTMPTIISADVIANIFSCADKKIVDIITTDGETIHFENVESFKMAPAEEINFNM